MCFINKLRLIFRLIIKVESIYIKYIRNIYSYISNLFFINSFKLGGRLIILFLLTYLDYYNPVTLSLLRAL